MQFAHPHVSLSYLATLEVFLRRTDLQYLARSAVLNLEAYGLVSSVNLCRIRTVMQGRKKRDRIAVLIQVNKEENRVARLEQIKERDEEDKKCTLFVCDFDLSGVDNRNASMQVARLNQIKGRRP